MAVGSLPTVPARGCVVYIQPTLVSKFIGQPLSSLVNHCLMEDRVPDALKVSRVVPVNKKGDSCMVISYHTIAIISAVVIKVHETV